MVEGKDTEMAHSLHRLTQIAKSSYRHNGLDFRVQRSQYHNEVDISSLVSEESNSDRLLVKPSLPQREAFRAFMRNIVCASHALSNRTSINPI